MMQKKNNIFFYSKLNNNALIFLLSLLIYLLLKKKQTIPTMPGSHSKLCPEPCRPPPLNLFSVLGSMYQMDTPQSGAQAPKGSPPDSPNLAWLAKLFEKNTFQTGREVFQRLREEGLPSIILQKLRLALLLYKKGTTYTVAKLVDFVFNDKVFFPGQWVMMGQHPNCSYGKIGDVSWSNGGLFLEGETISFMSRQPNGSFAYSTQSPEGIVPWDGTYPDRDPFWANGGGAP
jgi:hypothetical protein